MRCHIMSIVDLVCIKEGSRLRVRITCPGYLSWANCQFPRDIRVENAQFQVDSHDITLITRLNKWFYSVRRGAKITRKGPTEGSSLPTTIYQDTETEECAICLEAPKSIVFSPCGHYYVCQVCSQRLTQCPICRQTILHRVDKHLIEGL